MSNEELVAQIVEKCAGRISIFLGAGASMAVDLPDMVTFWKKAYGDDFVSSLDQQCNYKLASEKDINLPEAKRNKTSALRRLIQTACLEKGKISLDLEIIYDYLHNTPMLSAGRENIENLKKLFYFYDTTLRNSHGNGSPLFSGYCEKYTGFRNNFTKWVDNVYQSIKELRTNVDNSYLVKRNTKEEVKARDVYAFLGKLFAEYPPTIFTTNYDTIFEALDDSGKLKEIGYSLQSGSAPNDIGRHYYFSVSNYLTEIESPLFLFHMHGSVAWERQPDGRIEDHYPKLHENRSAIIEPVISKKFPEQTPFKEMYTIFEKTLQRNKVLLVIGFSFRDEEIKNIVENRLKSGEGFRVVCVAPENKKEPDLNTHLEALEKKYVSKFIWLKEYFGTPETEAKILKTVNGFVSK